MEDDQAELDAAGKTEQGLAELIGSIQRSGILRGVATGTPAVGLNNVALLRLKFRHHGVDDRLAIDELWTLAHMPEGETRGALQNALGVGEFSQYGLAERRKKYAERMGISERTLFRWESKAVQQMVHILLTYCRLVRETPRQQIEERLGRIRRELHEIEQLLDKLPSDE